MRNNTGMKLKNYSWELALSISLILATVVIYLLKILIIGDSGESNTLTYIFNALGFLPLNVLLVTLIINGLLSMRAKKEQQEKMKMIIGLFFSELGTDLLRIIGRCNTEKNDLAEIMNITSSWKKDDYAEAARKITTYRENLHPSSEELELLRNLLNEKHEFLLRIVENPVFLEGESNTELMRALFHLGEELSSRDDIFNLPASDTAHLTGDVKRVYRPLIGLWLSHMEYLSKYYPYLLSFSIRKNPFMERADTVVREDS